MNCLRLFAQFESNPSEQEKATIEAELRTFLLRFAPSAHLTTISEDGSWWIVVEGMAVAAGGWLALQAASWGVRRILNHVEEKVTERLNPPASSESRSPVPDQSWGNQQAPRAQAFSLLAILGSDMNDLAQAVGAHQILFGEWSEAFGFGRIVRLQRSTNEVTFSVIQTDSREDFDSRTTLGFSL